MLAARTLQKKIFCMPKLFKIFVVIKKNILLYTENVPNTQQNIFIKYNNKT